MECMVCLEYVDEKKLVCPNCGVGYKEEVERGIDVIGFDYEHSGTQKYLDGIEEEE